MKLKIIKENFERSMESLKEQEAQLSDEQMQAVTLAQSVFESIKKEPLASELEAKGVDPFQLSETLIKLAYGPWQRQFDAAVAASPFGPSKK